MRGQEWSIAQIAQGIAGILLVVLGGVVLAKTGLQLDHPKASHVLFTQTAWMALIELFLGILLLIGATSARDRTFGIFASLAATAVGLILALVPDAANGRFTGNDSTAGWVLAIIGAITAVVTLTAPSRVTSARDAVVERDREIL